MSAWAFYGRVSGLEQASNQSIPTQREACHLKAQEHGATEILDFIDAGVPGDLEWVDRPALTQLLDRVQQGALAGVVIYDPDRLARDLGVQLAITEIISKHRVRLEFCTQQFDASPEGTLFYQLRGAISQFERAKIRERTHRGRTKILREGRPANKPMPFGLCYHRDTNTWSVIPEQATVVRQIFAWAAAGKGPTWIARQLNALGIQPPRSTGAKRWWAHVIRRMLSNTTYMGKLFLHRWNQEGQRRNRYLLGARKVRVTERPQSEWIAVTVPALVPQALWQTVQAFLTEKRRRWAGIASQHYTYLASRLLRCGVCGSGMTGATATRKRGKTAYYRCNGRYGEQRLACHMPHLRAQELDATLWEAVHAWLTCPALYAAAVQRAVRAPTTTRELTANVEERLLLIRSDIARLQNLITQGALKEQEVQTALRNLYQQEASLLAETQPPDTAVCDTSTAYILELESLSPSERREQIRAVVAEVVAHPDGRLEVRPRQRTQDRSSPASAMRAPLS